MRERGRNKRTDEGVRGRVVRRGPVEGRGPRGCAPGAAPGASKSGASDDADADVDLDADVDSFEVGWAGVAVRVPGGPGDALV